MDHRRTRLSVMLAALAVLAATLVPLPAFADDSPTPSPTPTVEVVTPTPDPTPIDPTTPHDPVLERTTAPATYAGYAIVSIDNSTTPFVALTLTGPSLWPVNTTFTYRWYRGATDLTANTPATGTGYATKNYTPNTADSQQFLRVKVVATVPGYTGTTTAFSQAWNYSIVADSVVGIGGNPDDAPGSIVHVGSPSITYHMAGTVDAVSPSIAYVWKRDGAVIAGETATEYTLKPTDPGHVISAVLTYTATGAVPTVFVSPNLPIPLLTLPDNPTVAIAKSGTTTITLAASFDSDPSPTPGRVVTWKWLRDAAVISGATTASHVVVTADYGHTLTAVATITKPTYAPKPFQASTSDFSLLLQTGGNATGTLAVGATMTADADVFWTTGPVTATVTRQWLRNGAVVAAGASYRLVAADAGTTLSLRTTATLPGYLPSITTLSLGPVAKAVFGSPDVHLGEPVALRLTPSVTFTDPWPDLGSVTKTYRWYRNGVAIAGATGTSYKLTAADAHKQVSVRVTLSKPGYINALVIDDGEYTIEPIGILFIDGDARVEGNLGASVPPNFLVNGTLPIVHLDYQWLRDGAAISGATAVGYTAQSADRGHRVSVRVTASLPGYPVTVMTSEATQKLGDNSFADNSAPLQVVHVGTPAVLSVGSTGLTPAPTATAYQWFRAGVAIPGATNQSYPLTSADVGKQNTVRIIVTAPTYTPYVKTSFGIDFSLKALAAPTITSDSTGLFRAGDTLTLNPPGYKDGTNTTIVPTFARQWLRNGVAIPTATGGNYTLQSADFGKKITVRLTASAAGWNTITQVTAATPTIGTGALQVDPGGFHPQVVPGTSAGQLKASLDLSDIVTTGVTYSYQWKRNGANVSGATASTFTLASTDSAKLISVVVTVKKSAFANLSTETNGHAYGIEVLSAAVVIPIYGSGQVGGALHVAYADGPWHWQYAEAPHTVVTPTLGYQWYRNSVAIPGATSSTYSPVAADWNKNLTVRVYASGPGIVSTSALSGATFPMALGQNTSSGVASYITNPGIDTLYAIVIAGSLVPAKPTPVYAYQWYRELEPGDPVKIPGATKSTYKLVLADKGQKISVRIEVIRDKFVAGDSDYYIYSAGTEWSAIPSTTTPSFAATPVFGTPLPAPHAAYFDVNGDPIPVAPVYTYTWFRSSTPSTIDPGAHVQVLSPKGASYTLTTADVGKYIAVSVVAKYPGFVQSTATFSVSSQVQLGDLGLAADGHTIPAYADTAKLRLKTDMTLAGHFTVAPTSFTYQWYRAVGGGGETNIPGATSSLYTLTSADTGLFIGVRVTAHRAGYQNVTIEAWSRNYTIGIGNVDVAGDVETDSVLTATPSLLSQNPAGTTFAYQWYRQNPSTNVIVKLTGTGNHYKVLASDVGWNLFVKVHAVKPGYLTPTVTISLSLVHLAPLNASPGAVDFTLTSRVFYGSDHVTTVTQGVKIERSWYFNSTKIPGATSATYRPPASMNLSGFWAYAVNLSKPGYSSTGASVGKTIT